MNGSQQKALAKQKAPTSLFRNFYFGEDVVPAKKTSKNTVGTSRKMYVGFRDVLSRDGPISRFSHDEFHWLVRTAC